MSRPLVLALVYKTAACASHTHILGNNVGATDREKCVSPNKPRHLSTGPCHEKDSAETVTGANKIVHSN